MVGQMENEFAGSHKIRTIIPICPDAMYRMKMERNEEVKELLENMEEFFEYEMPSPINFPTAFKYHLQMYREYMNEQ